MSAPVLIHVVEDDDSVKTALGRLLEAAGFETRGYASIGEFLLNAPPDRPGCMLLDIRLPGPSGPSGLDLQDALRQMDVMLPVIFLTGHADVASSVRAMKAGAVDFLTKPVERHTLLDAVKRALERDAIQRTTRDEAASLRARFAVLSPIERRVFDQIVGGKLNKQVADELGIAERTVKLHRAHVMAKLGAASPAELGRLAERLELLASEARSPKSTAC